MSNEINTDHLNAIRHAAHSWTRTRIYKCQSKCIHYEECQLAGRQEDCLVIEHFLDEKRRIIESQPHIDVERDQFIIERALRLLFGLTLMEWHVFANSDRVFDDKGDLTPSLGKYYISWHNSFTRCLNELGLTPASAQQFKDVQHPLDIASRAVLQSKEGKGAQDEKNRYHQSTSS